MKKIRLVFLIGILGFLGLNARDRQIIQRKGDQGLDDYKVHTIGQLWSAVSNFGNYGDPNSTNTGRPSYDWPGGTHNYYLWEGRLWIGAKIGSEIRVSHADYGDYEWHPSPDVYPTGWGYIGSGTSMKDINACFDDYADDKAMGLRVFQKAMAWSVDKYNSFIAYEYKVVYNKNDFAGTPPDVLTNVYVSWVFDADVCNADPTDCHIDDLVSFDGYVAGEWKNFTYTKIPTDTLIVLADTVMKGSDSIPDQYTLWGDDPDERILVDINGEKYMHSLGANDITLSDGTPVTAHPIYRMCQYTTASSDTDTFRLIVGDTLTYGTNSQIVHAEVVPRNMSYIFDGDNPAVPGNDQGEYGACAGYIFGRLVYAPPSIADTSYVDANGDSVRIVRPYSHQWWNWESDPSTDVQKYEYMNGTHPDNFGYRFMPHPFDVGAPTFDYRFMITAGPYNLADGDTLRFVYVGGVGQGLNGGEDTYWGRGYLRGARQIADYALQAYYKGATHSDPYHPSTPEGDNHWIIPIPPEVPNLEYSAGNGVVKLAWDDVAEVTPDPMDKKYDFRGYRIYRSEYRPGNWEKLAEYDSTHYWGNYPHTYVDSTAPVGVPLYYAVGAYDSGRPPDTTTGMPAIPSLESGLNNYKTDANGAPIPIYLQTPPDTSVVNIDSILSLVRVVPNPYLGSAKWEGAPGETYMNKIAFIHLPEQCRIKIYTLTGDFVKEIVHNSGTGDEYWNLLSRNNQDAVSGVYIYKIEAYDRSGKFLGSKTGKFMILR